MSWNAEKGKYGREIIHLLYNEGMIKTWYRDKPDGWILISGLWSPFYIQLRPLSSYPILIKKVGHALGKLIKNEISDTTKCIGIAMAGIPISTAITTLEGIPSGFTRKIEGVRSITDFRDSIEKYGEHVNVEGNFENGDNLVLIDDLVTKFDSKLIAIEQVKYEIKQRKLNNIICNNVLVLLDREQGATNAAKKLDINLYSLIPFKSKGLEWLSKSFTEEEYNVIIDYLDNPEKYQNERIRKKLKEIKKV